MRTNNSLQEIKETLEKIRSEQFSEISPEIIETIIDIQSQNQESKRRLVGQVATHQAINKYIDVNS